jgi:hypothetical protein
VISGLLAVTVLDNCVRPAGSPHSTRIERTASGKDPTLPVGEHEGDSPHSSSIEGRCASVLSHWFVG